MKQQLKLNILACFSLIFFGCESLPPSKKVRAQQIPSPQLINLNEDWQFHRVDIASRKAGSWQQVFLRHMVRIEPLLVKDQWQETSFYRKKMKLPKTFLLRTALPLIN